MSGRAAFGDAGCPSMIFCASSVGFKPVNGSLPVASSYNTTPIDQMSADGVTLSPPICSGDMYETDRASPARAWKTACESRFSRLLTLRPPRRT